MCAMMAVMMFKSLNKLNLAYLQDLSNERGAIMEFLTTRYEKHQVNRAI